MNWGKWASKFGDGQNFLLVTLSCPRIEQAVLALALPLRTACRHQRRARGRPATATATTRRGRAKGKKERGREGASKVRARASRLRRALRLRPCLPMTLRITFPLTPVVAFLCSRNLPLIHYTSAYLFVKFYLHYSNTNKRLEDHTRRV